MASVNKVIIVGNLGGDPDVRQFPSGDKVANVSIATTDRWKDKATGEPKESTEWHRVVFGGRLAEIVEQYLRKGDAVYVEGSLRTRKWTDNATGQERFATEIRADNMQMLGGRSADRSSNGNDGYGGDDGYGAHQQPRAQRQQSHQQQQQQQHGENSVNSNSYRNARNGTY